MMKQEILGEFPSIIPGPFLVHSQSIPAIPGFKALKPGMAGIFHRNPAGILGHS